VSGLEFHLSLSHICTTVHVPVADSPRSALESPTRLFLHPTQPVSPFEACPPPRPRVRVRDLGLRT